MAVDRKFEVTYPTMDRLVRRPIKIDNTALLNPNSTSPLALCDGELVKFTATGTVTRATAATEPAFFCIDDRGDTGVQASRKLSVIQGGGGFSCKTVFFNAGLTTVGAPVMWGSVTVESLSRSGLIAHTGSNIVIGYVIGLSALNNSKLEVFVTCN